MSDTFNTVAQQLLMQWDAHGFAEKLGCGGCEALTTVASDYACLTCGRMLCGCCGNYCSYHREELGMSDLNETAVTAVCDVTGLEPDFVRGLVRQTLARADDLERVPPESGEQLVWVAYQAAIRGLGLFWSAPFKDIPAQAGETFNLFR